MDLKAPKYLIRMFCVLLQHRFFYLETNEAKSSLEFQVEEGLQQGTVNAPLLFNIFTSSILNSFNLNTNNGTASLAFADDLIIYVTDTATKNAQTKLENLTNLVAHYYKSWHPRINALKCETILFRKQYDFSSKKQRDGWKTFTINIKDAATNSLIAIPHKRTVKYLGVYIDDLIRVHQHPEIQLDKAKNAFWANSKLFYSKHVPSKAKIICYSLLVRPILTYAVPIWYNQSASLM